MFHLSWPLYWLLPFLITPERGREEAARTGNGKKGFTQNWIRQKGFCTWGIQIRPFAARWAEVIPKTFHHPDLYTGVPISYYPREWNNRGAGNEKKDSPKNDVYKMPRQKLWPTYCVLKNEVEMQNQEPLWPLSTDVRWENCLSISAVSVNTFVPKPRLSGKWNKSTTLICGYDGKG